MVARAEGNSMISPANHVPLSPVSFLTRARRAYPDKTARAALLFTEGPRLIEVPAAALAAALGKVLTDRCHAPVKVP